MPKPKELCKRYNVNDIPVRTKKAILKDYKQLIEENVIKGEPREKMDIIIEICDRHEVCLASFYRIKKSGAVPSPNTRRIHIKYKFCEEDYELIDNIIINLNKMNRFVTIKDVYNYMKSDNQTQISFKNCGLKTFYKIMKQMKYKYIHSNKIIREEIIKSKRIQNKIKDYLIEKLRLQKLY